MLMTLAVIGVTALFSSWVLLEALLLFAILCMVRNNAVLWPSSEKTENYVFFSLFWGLLLGMVFIPILDYTLLPYKT